MTPTCFFTTFYQLEYSMLLMARFNINNSKATKKHSLLNSDCDNRHIDLYLCSQTANSIPSPVSLVRNEKDYLLSKEYLCLPCVFFLYSIHSVGHL